MSDEKKLIVTSGEAAAQAAMPPEILLLQAMAQAGMRLANLLAPYKLILEQQPSQTLMRLLGEHQGQARALTEVSDLLFPYREGEEDLIATLRAVLEDYDLLLDNHRVEYKSEYPWLREKREVGHDKGQKVDEAGPGDGAAPAGAATGGAGGLPSAAAVPPGEMT